jgi:O-antigen/teichoic acid export membrane protein
VFTWLLVFVFDTFGGQLEIEAATIKARILAICPAKVRALAARVERSPVGYRLARGASWSLAGVVIARFLGLLSSIVAARLLGKVSFGALGILQSTTAMFQVFAGAAMGLTATKHVAEFRCTDPGRAGRIIALSNAVAGAAGILLAVLLVIFAPWLATHTLAEPQLTPLLRLGALVLLLGSLSGTQAGALAGFECFKELAHVNLWSGLFGFPVTVAAVYWDGLTGAVWALVLTMAFTCVMNFLVLQRAAKQRDIRITLRSSRQEWPLLWTFTLPTLLGAILTAPVYWACNAMLVNRPGGYAEMGILNAANQWYVAVLFVPGVLAQVLLPIITERLSQQQREHSRRLLRASIIANGVIAAVIVTVGGIFSPVIMRFYGAQFAGAWPTLVAVLLAAGLQTLQTPIYDFMIAKGRMWTILWLNAAWAATILAMTALLVRWGAFGVASARLLAYIATVCWISVIAYRLLASKTNLQSQLPRRGS